MGLIFSFFWGRRFFYISALHSIKLTVRSSHRKKRVVGKHSFLLRACMFSVSVLLSLGSYLQSDGSFCAHFPQVRFASRDFGDMLETHPGTLNHQGTMVDFLWLLGWPIIPDARLFWLSSIEIAPRLKGLKVHVFLGSRKRSIYKRLGEFCERLPSQKPGLNSVWTM